MKIKSLNHVISRQSLTLLLGLAMSNFLSAIDLDIEPLVRSEVGIFLNQEEVMLGKQLFHDKRLSSDNSISCASCHDVNNGGDDGTQFSVGVGNVPGEVNTPTVFNSRFSVAQFWDGRAPNLAEQVDGPVHNPIEMNSNWPDIVKKLSMDRALAKRFKRLYANGLSEDNIKSAIVSYEKSLVTYDAPFDRFLLGDVSAVDDQVKNGYQLFKNYGCIGCHQGKAVGGNMFQVFGIAGSYFSDRAYVRKSDFGRFNVTGSIHDKYSFKVPSLRNVEQTAPYLHDGSVATLEQAIKLMARYQLGRPIKNEDVDDIVAFLKSLTGNIEDYLK